MRVLSLVLLDDTHRHGAERFFFERLSSLNPCSLGRYSPTLSKDVQCVGAPGVLILVLLDDTHRPGRGWLGLVDEAGVLILVLLDDTHLPTSE